MSQDYTQKSEDMLALASTAKMSAARDDFVRLAEEYRLLAEIEKALAQPKHT